MASIYQLPKSRHGFYCRDLALHFPRVARVMEEPREPPEYTLETAYDVAGLAEIDLRPARTEFLFRPDPTLDSEWLIVRHHRTLEGAYGYLNAVLDLEGEVSRTQKALWQSEDGLFTLAVRPPLPGRPAPLIIYRWEAYVPVGALDPWDERHAVIGPSGPLDPEVSEPRID